MKIVFKIVDRLLERVRVDLARTHDFAAERVGFLACRVGTLEPEGVVILAHDYWPVEDQHYIDDPNVGAMIGSSAIRKALEFALNNKAGIFHIHRHEHVGRPRFSRIDTRETAKFVPDFWNVRPEMPHGALVASRDSLFGMCWYPGISTPIEIGQFVLVGAPLTFIRNHS